MMNTLNAILLQVPKSADMADAGDTGKFFVVIAVVALLFTGIVTYMISVDRRLRNIEKKQS